MKRILLLFLILFSFFLISCSKEEEIEQGASPSPKETALIKEDLEILEPISKEELCYIISNAIHDLDYLRDSYLTVDQTVDEGSESDFYKILFGVQEPLSTSAKMASLMKQITEKTNDGKEFTYHVYDGDLSFERFIGLLSDYEEINKDYRQACLEALHYGYIDFDYSSHKHEICFSPKEILSVYDASQIINKVFLGRSLPADSIRVNHWDDESHISLHINKIPCLIAAKEIERHMQENDKVFFTYTIDELSLCLWYNTSEFGMFALPLLFLTGQDCLVEVSYLDKVNLDSKIRISSLLFPIDHRQAYIDHIDNIVLNKESTSISFGHIGLEAWPCEHSVYMIRIGEVAG